MRATARNRAHVIGPKAGAALFLAFATHHTRVSATAALIAILALGPGCGGSLPRPAAAQVSTEDYVAVPFAPRVPPVEFLPPSPAKGAVWVDGSWEWSGTRYVWRYGSWVVPPAGARLARWAVVRREVDGQLFFAPSSWKDAAGRPLDSVSFVNALGPRAMASPRLGGRPITRGTEPLDRQGRGRASGPGPETEEELEDVGTVEGDNGD